LTSLQRIFNTRLKRCHLLFSAVIAQHFSKNRMIISVVAAKIWYRKNVRFLLGHPVYCGMFLCWDVLDYVIIRNVVCMLGDVIVVDVWLFFDD